jgi:2-dehydro-3-deoxy-D-arabinonate dehydratase
MTSMKLYKTTEGIVIEVRGQAFRLVETNWDALVMRAGLVDDLESRLAELEPIGQVPSEVLAPIGQQEVWAAGVTYYRSRTARMEESKAGGAQSFYDRVYAAERPELFFKATPDRVVGPHRPVRILSDSRWSVPEPELTLVCSPAGAIIGYTIGNDMSSRDIEGENPLYLPQAKVYDQCCALGPCILLQNRPLDQSTEIHLEIQREGATAFAGRTSLAELKRSPRLLVDYLFRERSFPYGCFLLTGTGIVPDDAFTLKQGDEIRISIGGIGTLVNSVVCKSADV